MRDMVSCNVEVLTLLCRKRNWLLLSELFHNNIKLVFKNFIFIQITRFGLDSLSYFDFCLIRRMYDMLALCCADSIQPSKVSLLGYHLAI